MVYLASMFYISKGINISGGSLQNQVNKLRKKTYNYIFYDYHLKELHKICNQKGKTDCELQIDFYSQLTVYCIIKKE